MNKNDYKTIKSSVNGNSFVAALPPEANVIDAFGMVLWFSSYHCDVGLETPLHR